MTLADWLTQHRVGRKDFATQIGVSPSYVTALCAGTVWPGRDVAERIRAATAGAVTANDFMAPRAHDDAAVPGGAAA